MSRSDAVHNGLALVLERFPEKAVVVRRLVLRDAGFRGICEDYALAREGLATFEARPDAAMRPEVADYQTVIAELEHEIAALVSGAAGLGT